MKFIFGGAYQGKTEYALKSDKTAKSVFVCAEETADIDFSCDVISAYHLFVLNQIRAGIDPIAYIEAHSGDFMGKIIICDDVSCGVVPMDRELRKWREALGRCMGLFTRQADEVIRVFCGIGMKLK